MSDDDASGAALPHSPDLPTINQWAILDMGNGPLLFGSLEGCAAWLPLDRLDEAAGTARLCNGSLVRLGSKRPEVQPRWTDEELEAFLRRLEEAFHQAAGLDPR